MLSIEGAKGRNTYDGRRLSIASSKSSERRLERPNAVVDGDEGIKSMMRVMPAASPSVTEHVAKEKVADGKFDVIASVH